MRTAPVLLLVALLATPLLPATATDVVSNDAGSGRDAPDTIAAALADPLVVEPGVLYTGYTDGWLDPADVYGIRLAAGDHLVIDFAGPVGCIDVYRPDGSAQTTPADCTEAYTNLAGLAVDADVAGVWFVKYSYLEPQVYRFSFGVGARGPSPYVADPLPAGSGALPAVAPATETGPHVVIAVVDTGVNPYHRFLAAPALVDHPSTWLPGFPADAPSLALTLGQPNYADAIAADNATWAGVQRGKLYTIPGTRVVGAISFSEYGDALTPAGTTPILDEYGHGSHSAGLAAGADLAAPDGNVLIVMVEVSSADFARGVAWAASQPWIDAVSLSAGAAANVPLTGSMPEASHAAVAAGKPFFVASGNGFSDTGLVPDHCSTYTSGYTGPVWATRVGAADPNNGNPTFWHCLPVEVVAHTNVPSTDMATTSGASSASGTSAATPNAAGAFGQLLLRAKRASLGGDRFDVLQHLYNASAPAAPAAGTNNEPGLAQTAFFDQGYGLVDSAAIDRAAATLAGAPAPRPELDAWWRTDHALRVALWGDGSIGGAAVAQNDAGSGRDAGGDASGAVPVAPGGVYHGFIDGVTDSSDWYSFHADAGQTLHAQAQGVVGCFYLHDPSGAQASFGCDVPGLPATVDQPINQTGTWYLEYSYVDAHGYDFSLALDAPAPALPVVPGVLP